jgi:hypothetical protein
MGKKLKRKKTSRKRQAKTSTSKKRPIIILLAVLVAVGSYFFYFKGDRNPYAYRPDKTTLDIEALKGGETRPTAYNVAGQNRELLDSMHCYCNCKKTIGHKSLLSCFADKHAVDCKICQDQAFYAASRFQEGNDIAQVRLAVDKKFWRPLR